MSYEESQFYLPFVKMFWPKKRESMTPQHSPNSISSQGKGPVFEFGKRLGAFQEVDIFIFFLEKFSEWKTFNNPQELCSELI